MLKLIDVTKKIDNVYQPILKNINFELAQGDFCVVVGLNGSGKSSLLKTISGEYICSNGAIEFNKKNITKDSVVKRAKHLTYITQDLTISCIEEMSVFENVVLYMLRTRPAHLKFYSYHRIQVIKLLQNLGLNIEHYIDQPMGTLSGGQKQMIATAIAMQNASSLILFDEHTSALDPKAHRLLMNYIAEQVKNLNLTAIMVTHNLDDAVKYGNRLIMMHQGEIILDVSGIEKNNLTTTALLKLFHSAEDKILLR